MKAIGDPVDRVDGVAKVTGAARYAAEVPTADVAHAVIVTSTIARGRVARLDVEDAARAPGVVLVLTPANAPRITQQTDLAEKPSPTDRVLQVLQDDIVHYAGQPIACVVADTLERARAAAALVVATYERAGGPVAVALAPEEPVTHASAPPAIGPGAPPSHEDNYARGDAASALREADVSVSATYTTPFEVHNPMEPHGTVAVWQGEQNLVVYDSTQGIFEVRRKLAQTFGLPKENVRVIDRFVGGGFGCKGSVWSHVVIAAMAAKATRRAVKLVLSRAQMFGPVGGRPQTVQKIELGAKRDGTLTAIRHDVVTATSRFDEFVERCTAPVRALYACPAQATSQRLQRLDIGTPTFMRAPGESTGNFAIESAMDELSYAAGVDPIALRMKNHADRDPETGRPWSSKSLAECYRRAAYAIGWSRRDPRPASMRDGAWLVGLGMATSTYPAHVRPASALARLLADGTALVLAGTQDIGTGTYTVMTQIAADALGVPVSSVRFDLGDTDMPETPTSGGSMTAASVGSAVRMACLAVKEKIGAVARPGEAYAETLRRLGQDSIEATQKTQLGEASKRYAMRSFGAQMAEVRVDPALGTVRVSRLVGAFAAGRILNAKTATSQFIGGMVWGMSMALMESSQYDPGLGRIMNASLEGYHVPVNADVPGIEVLLVEEEDPYVNEIGAKGIGEIGICGTAAAIANAVFHATGKRVRSLPITIEKLL